MKIKKYIPFICAIAMLIMSLSLPYFLLIMQDYSLLNKNVVQDIENNGYDNKNLTTIQKLKFISYFLNINSKQYTVDNSTFSFMRELDIDEIESVYQEIQKLYDLNGMIEISKESIQNYYRCIMNTYQQDDVSVTITRISFSMNNTAVDLWFDNDTYQIYQYSIFSKQESHILKKLDANNALRNYLKIDKEEYKNLYTVFQDDYSVEVYINHVSNVSISQ